MRATRIGWSRKNALCQSVDDVSPSARTNRTHCRTHGAGSNFITIWDFTGRKDSSGNQRESATLFPQGLSLYSRRAFPLFPQGCPFIPAGLALYSRRASAGAPGIQLLPGLRRRRWPGSVPPGMRAREDSAITEVGCCPQAAAACKLRGSPRPGPQLEQGT